MKLPRGPGTRLEYRFPTVGIELLYSPVEGKCLENAGRMLREAVGFDMSLSGIAFDVREPMEPGSYLVVEVASPIGGHAERVITEIRWCNELGNGLYRVGTQIIESEPGDVTIEADDRIGESVGAGPSVPTEIECVCGSCGVDSRFVFEGNQEGRWAEGVLPLYTCSSCQSTLSIIGLLATNR